LNLTSKIAGGSLDKKDLYYEIDSVALSLDQIVVFSSKKEVQRFAARTPGFVDVEPAHEVSIEWRVHAVHPPLCADPADFDGHDLRPYSASLNGTVHWEINLSRSLDSATVPLEIEQKAINLATPNWGVMPQELTKQVCQGLIRKEFFRTPGWVEAGGNSL
jgi:hypothetical protein